MFQQPFGFLLGTVCLSRAADSNTAVSSQVAEATNNFSLNLFKAVLDDNTGNAVVSPVSVSTLLALVQQGAGGNTLSQLTDGLYLDKEQSRQGYSQLTRNLKESSGNATLEFANGAFLNEGYQVKPEFQNVLENDFQSTIETVKFSESAAAAGEINSWVANHTHDKIRDLVTPDSLDALTRTVLVNAIYFKDFWNKTFMKENTRSKDFFIEPNTKKQVSTMHLQANLLTGYLEDLNSRWLQLPFEGDRFYLLIILPNEINGVNNVAKRLTGSQLSDLINNLERRGSSQDVMLSLPKFKLQTTLTLGPTLQKIGLTDIFSGRANLSGISEEPVYVSEVIQKAVIEVDEEGATAAAATEIGNSSGALESPGPPQVFNVNYPFLALLVDDLTMIVTAFSAVPSRPVVFNVDHPFIALLVDDLNKLPLFACRVTDPEAS